MRSLLRAALGLVAVAALLSACGQAGADPGPADSPPRGTSTSSAPPVTSAPPTTARTSPAAPAAPAVVVGLGDSVTAGTACACTDFVRLYAARLGQRAGQHVRPVNLGVGGLTTSGLAGQLADPATRGALARASLVVVTIGANDLSPLIGRWQQGRCGASCIAAATAAMGRRLGPALTSLRAAVPAGTRVLVTTYWNVFEDGDVADHDYGPGFASWSDAVTRSANAVIGSAAAAQGDQTVDLYTPFEGAGDHNPTELLADDGDHPNAAGNRLIAEALVAATGTLQPTG